MAVDRKMSASPPPAPLSKRDKRRNNITDKLSDMIETFAADQHQHYRAQLQAIQVDMTLILRASPYNNVPLDDDAEDIEAEIEKITGGNMPHITNDAAKKDYAALAGKRYHDYVQDINKAMEQRDADLTALKVYHSKAIFNTEQNETDMHNNRTDMMAPWQSSSATPATRFTLPSKSTWNLPRRYAPD